MIGWCLIKVMFSMLEILGFGFAHGLDLGKQVENFFRHQVVQQTVRHSHHVLFSREAAEHE
jgi:hypothetical protein